jgi:hypothetical protein
MAGMKFTIRDVFWLTALVAMAVTCCLEREKRIAERISAQKKLDATQALLVREAEDKKEIADQLLNARNARDQMLNTNKLQRKQLEERTAELVRLRERNPFISQPANVAPRFGER